MSPKSQRAAAVVDVDFVIALFDGVDIELGRADLDEG